MQPGRPQHKLILRNCVSEVIRMPASGVGLTSNRNVGRVINSAVNREKTDTGEGAHLGGMARLTPALRAVAAGSAALHAVAPGLTTEIMLRHFMQPRRRARRDYRTELPGGAYHLRVPFNNRELTAWAWGFSGPAILLIHGWEDHAGSMLHLVPELLARGHRVCVIDLPGHGLSPRIPTHLVDASFAIEAMVRAYGPFDSIVAHSFGATATCLMLERASAPAPDRLALISPMQDIDQHLQIFATIAGLSPPRVRQLRARMAQALGCPPEAVCALRAVRALRLRALVIHDRHDPVIPHGTGKKMAGNLHGSRFVSTAHLGHRRLLRCSDVIADIINHVGPCNAHSNQ